MYALLTLFCLAWLVVFVSSMLLGLYILWGAVGWPIPVIVSASTAWMILHDRLSYR